MKILDRFIIKEFIKYLVLALALEDEQNVPVGLVRGQLLPAALGIVVEIGAGGEWQFTPRLLFFAEAGFRLAPAIGLAGTGTYRDSGGANSSESGPLWFYQQRGADGLGHDLLLIHETAPSGTDILAARHASVNLTGTAVKAVVKLRF